MIQWTPCWHTAVYDHPCSAGDRPYSSWLPSSIFLRSHRRICDPLDLSTSPSKKAGICSATSCWERPFYMGWAGKTKAPIGRPGSWLFCTQLPTKSTRDSYLDAVPGWWMLLSMRPALCSAWPSPISAGTPPWGLFAKLQIKLFVLIPGLSRLQGNLPEKILLMDLDQVPFN